MRKPCLLLLLSATLWISETCRAAPPLEIVTASYFGTAEDDDLQDAAVSPDGTIYIAGNPGSPANDLPGGVGPKTLGSPPKELRCGLGFVAQLSPDGRKLLRYAEFAPGILIATTVRVNDQGVYLGGYASDGLAGLLKDKQGL